MTLRFRFDAESSPAHVYCRLFIAPAANQTFACCGQLIFTRAEWPEMQRKFLQIGQVLADGEGIERPDRSAP